MLAWIKSETITEEIGPEIASSGILRTLDLGKARAIGATTVALPLMTMVGIVQIVCSITSDGCEYRHAEVYTPDAVDAVAGFLRIAAGMGMRDAIELCFKERAAMDAGLIGKLGGNVH